MARNMGDFNAGTGIIPPAVEMPSNAKITRQPAPAGTEKFTAKRLRPEDRPTPPHREVDYEGNAINLSEKQKNENAAAIAAQGPFDERMRAQDKDDAAKAAADKAAAIIAGAGVAKGIRKPKAEKPTAPNKAPGVVATATLPGAQFKNRASKAHRLMTDIVNNHLASDKLDGNARANVLIAQSHLDEAAPLIANQTGSAHIKMANHDQVGSNEDVIAAIPHLRAAHDALNHPDVHAHAAGLMSSHELPTADVEAVEGNKDLAPLVKQSAKPLPDLEFGRRGRMRTDSPEFEKLKELASEGSLAGEKIAAVKPTRRMSAANRRALTADAAARLQANVRKTRTKANDVTTVDVKFRSDANDVGQTPKFDATSGVKNGDAGMAQKSGPSRTNDLVELMARGREAAKTPEGQVAQAAGNAEGRKAAERKAAGPQKRKAKRAGKPAGYAMPIPKRSAAAQANAELPSVNPGGDPNTRPLGFGGNKAPGGKK